MSFCQEREWVNVWQDIKWGEIEWSPVLRHQIQTGCLFHNVFIIISFYIATVHSLFCLVRMMKIVIFSSGIYGVSGISMDIPEISMYQDPATHCHQIRRHTLTFYCSTGLWRINFGSHFFFSFLEIHKRQTQFSFSPKYSKLKKVKMTPTVFKRYWGDW